MMREIFEPVFEPERCEQIRIIEHGVFGFDKRGAIICGLMLKREPIEEIICGLAERWECH